MGGLMLYTIGHSNMSAEDFLAALREHDIHVLVDVRSAPISRYVPHFNKREIENFLKANDVDYKFAGEYLGGRPENPSLYKEQEIPDKSTKRQDFLKLVQYDEMMKSDTYQKGIQRLLQLMRETTGHVGIMCSEGNPLECHRHHLIARSLIDPTRKVVSETLMIYHILKDRSLVQIDETSFQKQSIQRPLL